MSARTPSLRRIDAVGVVGCLALAGVAYLAGFAPLLRQRAERQSQRTALAERRLQVSALQETLRGLAEHRHASEAELDAHPVKLRSVSDRNQRLASIVQLAVECGLNVPDIAHQPPRNDQRFTVVPFVLRGVGGYPTAADFFARLHREFKDTAVTSFTLAAPDPTDQGSAPEWPAGSVGPPPPFVPARADFTIELAWFAAPADRAASAAK